MDKKTAIAIGIAIILAVGFYFYSKKNSNPQNVEAPKAENLGSNVNNKPLEKAPDLNPVNKTNPFKNAKTNPFE